MLYISHSIGGGGSGRSAKSTFGLRFDQIRVSTNAGDPIAGDTVCHRDLVDWQWVGYRDVRVLLGNKLTYTLTTGSFSSSNHFVMQMRR
jgi:hypothetical protein